MDPVAARLAAFPGAQRFPGHQLDLFIVRDFLSSAQCVGLCAMIDRDRRPSTLADDQGYAAFRTSETCDLPGEDRLVHTVRAAMSTLTGIPMTHGEPLQGQRYAVGQEFKAHTDTFNPGSADYYAATADMGQRTWTAMAFLNKPEEGGATRFKTIGKTIQPETGKLLLWNNLLPDGSPNPATLHQGLKVRRGTKYVLTQWYREYARS